MKRAFLRFFALALCLLVLSCGSNDSKPAVEAPAQVGEMAPDFNLKDLWGNDISLSQLRGKVILLEFWATWCPPCKEAVPDLVVIQDKFKDRGFVVLAVSIDSGKDAAGAVAEFSRDHHINYPVLVDDKDIAVAYSVFSIPVGFLISKEGKIVDSFIGFGDGYANKISSSIEKII
jgi:peroxiredoxin